MNVIPTSPAPCGALRSHSAAARASPLPTPPPRGGSAPACLLGLASSRRRSHEGAKPPQTPPLGSGSGVGIPWGGRRSTPTLRVGLPPMVPSRNQPSSPTWARKGSMGRCAHRPLSQSVFWLDRRVNSAIRERGRLDLLRRPRAPVVTDCCIDPPARTCGAGSRRPRKHPACSSPSYRCFPSQFLVENAFRADIPDYL